MKKFTEVYGGQIGVGYTREQAKEDAFINLCKFDKRNDKSGIYQKRYEQLHPWFPKEGMLHLSEVGCICYENNTLYETKSGRSIQVGSCSYGIYYYLANLFGDLLSYTDIAVVLQKELNSFFRYIIADITMIQDMPCIYLQDKSSGFTPKTVYTTLEGVIIGLGESEIGIKYLGDSMYYTVPFCEKEDCVCLLSYLGYKVGVICSDTDIVVKQ